MTETQHKLIATIQGNVYESLLLSGVGEKSISYTIKLARDDFLGHSLINYIKQYLCPLSKQFIQLHKQYTDPETWKSLPQSFPEVRKYNKLRSMILWTWRKRPRW